MMRSSSKRLNIELLMQSSSCVSPNYMAHQFDLNERMRGILIDWLIEVCKMLYIVAFNQCRNISNAPFH